jgi:acetolactate synthase-1/2/3 large subunit
MGSFHLWIARHLYSFRPRHGLIINGQQTLGVALPWSIAASVVWAAEKNLSISGDEGFLFSAMELDGRVLQGKPGAHGLGRRRLRHGGYPRTAEIRAQIGVDSGPIDYVKYAEVFGAVMLAAAATAVYFQASPSSSRSCFAAIRSAVLKPSVKRS